MEKNPKNILSNLSPGDEILKTNIADDMRRLEVKEVSKNSEGHTVEIKVELQEGPSKGVIRFIYPGIVSKTATSFRVIDS
ncbi:MAG: hypothetical protein ABEI53_02875 [Candidatus Magasanikbacteria bacterium]